MDTILQGILPVFIILILGAVSHKINLLGENNEKVMTNFVVFIALPLLLFVAIAEAPIHQLLNLKFIVATIIAMFGLYFSIIIFCIIKNKSFDAKDSLRALSMSFPNAAFMGTPIIMSLLGKQALLPLAIVNFFDIAKYIITSILYDSVIKDKSHQQKPIFKVFANTIIKQPVLLAIVMGTLFSMFSIHLPVSVSKTCYLLGETAGPCAVFMLGSKLLGLRLQIFKSANNYIGLILKLVVMPVIGLVMFLLLGVSPYWSVAGVILLGLPCGALPYILAVSKGEYIQESSELFIISTTVSLFTLSIIVLFVPCFWPSVHFL
jgi:hypothetical protein